MLTRRSPSVDWSCIVLSAAFQGLVPASADGPWRAGTIFAAAASGTQGLTSTTIVTPGHLTGPAVATGGGQA